MLATMRKELRAHAPFTLFGTSTGIVIVAVMSHLGLPRFASVRLFWVFHPIHVLLRE